jgi:hypothetical protein
VLVPSALNQLPSSIVSHALLLAPALVDPCLSIFHSCPWAAPVRCPATLRLLACCRLLCTHAALFCGCAGQVCDQVIVPSCPQSASALRSLCASAALSLLPCCVLSGVHAMCVRCSYGSSVSPVLSPFCARSVPQAALGQLSCCCRPVPELELFGLLPRCCWVVPALVQVFSRGSLVEVFSRAGSLVEVFSRAGLPRTVSDSATYYEKWAGD